MKTPWADYTLEFKKEAVRLVQGGQRQPEAGASPGISGQTPGNWIKADAGGRLTERKAVKAAGDEQMEISRLKAGLAKTRMERDILKNQRGLMPPVGVETFLRYLACGRERPSTFWWHVTP